jgi:hypothetical protein
MRATISIVGCGIAGLYFGIRLLEKGQRNVVIYEASKRPGGRIHTVQIDGMHIEAGAGRFNKNHTLLWSLLEKYDLIGDIIPLSPQKQYIKDGKHVRFDCDMYLKRAVEASKKYDDVFLRSIPFKVFLTMVFPTPTLVDDIMYSFGYTTEMHDMSAWETVRLLESDFLEDVPYYVLKGGLSRLIDIMATDFIDRGGVIRYNTRITKYVDGTIYTQNDTVIAKSTYTIFCVPRSALLNIAGIVCDDARFLVSDNAHNTRLKRCLDALKPQMLLRMYARFPSDWTLPKRIKRAATNDMIRYIIPVDPSRNTMMISYTDGIYAAMLSALPEKERNTFVMNRLRHVYPSLHIPDPIWVHSFIWPEGAHYWTPGYSPKMIYKNRKQMISQYKYIICGEVISENNHAWIEGALQTVEEAWVPLSRLLCAATASTR